VRNGEDEWTARFPTRPAFLYGAVRVRGSEGDRVRVRILELSSTSSQYNDPIITSPCEMVLNEGHDDWWRGEAGKLGGTC
jgi:DNA-directed RNA polymerase subunit E'/Rpb7